MAGVPGEVLTTGEAARLCGLSRSTLRRAVASGQLSAWRTPGQHLRFSRQACVEFLRATGAAELAGRVERLRPLGGTPVEGVATGQAGPD
ncbi:MAG: helix-turn-helix domain-containing protein [Chloroflexi bacterium]|nr:MAG: helix-turn-helix domain-containing protein [Chloroflexota bacterium]